MQYLVALCVTLSAFGLANVVVVALARSASSSCIDRRIKNAVLRSVCVAFVAPVGVLAWEDFFESNRGLAPLVALAAISIPLYVIIQAIEGVLAGSARFQRQALNGLISAGVIGALQLILASSWEVKGALIATMLGLCVLSIWSAGLARRLMKAYALSVAEKDIVPLKSIQVAEFLGQIQSVALPVAIQGVLIARGVSPESVGIFAVALSIYSACTMPGQITINFVTIRVGVIPPTSRRHARWLWMIPVTLTVGAALTVSALPIGTWLLLGRSFDGLVHVVNLAGGAAIASIAGAVAGRMLQIQGRAWIDALSAPLVILCALITAYIVDSSRVEAGILCVLHSIVFRTVLLVSASLIFAVLRLSRK